MFTEMCAASEFGKWICYAAITAIVGISLLVVVWVLAHWLITRLRMHMDDSHGLPQLAPAILMRAPDLREQGAYPLAELHSRDGVIVCNPDASTTVGFQADDPTLTRPIP